MIRLQPNGAIILINHRMHEDDLSGRLIEQMKAGNDQWTIVELPAIALDNDQLRRPKGEALWPSQYPLEASARIRANTLARYWSALYMQNPVPEEGELFSPDRIGVKATAEDVFLWVRAQDLAGSVEGDWTVGLLMGKTRKGSYVVGDVVRFRRPQRKLGGPGSYDFSRLSPDQVRQGYEIARLMAPDSVGDTD